MPPGSELVHRMTERHWYVKQCRLFERLSAAQIARLESCARMRTFAKNCPIYLPSDESQGVFLLAAGRVKICSFTPEGKQAILAFIEPGEIFGELAILGGGDREEHAEAVTASTVVLLPGDEMLQLMAESPELSLGITRLIGLRRQRIERRLKSLLFHSNRDRLVHLLLELSQSYGKRDALGLLIDLKLSHQDLASIIGSTRETVTVLLGELQLEGLLKVSRQRIVIRDIQRLASGADRAKTPSPVAETSAPHVARKRQVLLEGET